MLEEFAANQVNDVLGYGDLPSWISSHIDFNEIWEEELRHEYTDYKTYAGTYYVIRNY